VAKALQLDRRLVERVVGEGSPFLPTDGLPWVAALEAAHLELRAEVDAALVGDLRLPRMTDVLGVDQGDDGRWRTLVLVAQGRPISSSVARLPRTAAAVAEVPGLQSALLSVFPPGMHLPAHRAGNKGVLRYHLGIRVPDPPGRCRLRVGEETVDHREGASILFDDTFEHEAWNDTDGERVTLLLEVLRPLPPGVAQVNRLLQGFYGRMHPEAAGAAERVVELDAALNGRLGRPAFEE
jgi:beta-hydroxylase